MDGTPRATGQGRLPAPLHHRPLQPALHVLHAAGGGARRATTARSSATRSSPPSRASPPTSASPRCASPAASRSSGSAAPTSSACSAAPAASTTSRSPPTACCCRGSPATSPPTGSSASTSASTASTPERFARITRGGRLERHAGRHRRRLLRRVLAGQDQHAAAARRGGRARRVRRAHARVRRARALHRVHAAGPARRRRRRARRRGPPAAGRRRAAPAHAASTCSSAHDGPYGHGPAQYWKVAGARGTIGFIAGVSEHFCETCNRLRLTADGRLRTCLFSGQEVDIRPLLARPGRPARRHRDRGGRQEPTTAAARRCANERSMSQIGG